MSAKHPTIILCATPEAYPWVWNVQWKFFVHTTPEVKYPRVPNIQQQFFAQHLKCIHEYGCPTKVLDTLTPEALLPRRSTSTSTERPTIFLYERVLEHCIHKYWTLFNNSSICTTCFHEIERLIIVLCAAWSIVSTNTEHPTSSWCRLTGSDDRRVKFVNWRGNFHDSRDNVTWVSYPSFSCAIQVIWR